MFKGRQFDQSVILLCVRSYLAYNLSLRDLEEMMAERGIAVDHTTIYRWTVRFSPLLLERFNRRKRAVAGPSAHPAPHPTNARLQITSISRDHPVRHRDGPHDAETTGEVRLQSESILGRAVPNPCRVIGLVSDLCAVPFSRCNKTSTAGAMGGRPFRAGPQ